MWYAAKLRGKRKRGGSPPPIPTKLNGGGLRKETRHVSPSDQYNYRSHPSGYGILIEYILLAESLLSLPIPQPDYRGMISSDDNNNEYQQESE